MTNKEIQKPSWFLYATEAIRAIIEWLRALFFMAFYQYPNLGKGRPVLVVPGFLGSDWSTGMLRKFLQKLGFTAYGWGLGQNLGDLQDIDRLVQKVANIQTQHQQKVILIGWSLGGIYVREIAKRRPENVAQVFTLGSPFAAPDAPNHAVWIFNLFNDFGKIDPHFREQVPSPAPVRTTALYSYQDGIVPWEACRELQEDELRQNILVKSSHIGFVRNAQVFQVLVERL
ncbi:MAG: alpha/beta hydrolase [Spirosomaceae bacterium]|jgi:pimeloyl-ACP methyl ester carboxylesterase|nr:alpha/beta hydrolase [Spirosomataceae bacterium]